MRRPLLLDGAVTPLAMRWGFLKCSLDSALHALENWPIGSTTTTERIRVSLRAALERLDPLTPSWSRILAIQCDGGWTAIFDNGMTGGDPISIIGPVTRSHRIQGVVVAHVPKLMFRNGRRAFYEQVQLELLKETPTEFLNYERTISVTNDAEGWEFSTAGIEQPFEALARYGAPKIHERFDAEMLRDYCDALGLRIFDETFYTGDAAVLSWPAKRAEKRSLRSLRRSLVLDTATPGGDGRRRWGWW